MKHTFLYDFFITVSFKCNILTKYKLGSKIKNGMERQHSVLAIFLKNNERTK